jgi:Immunoglobulin I-set domain
LRSAPESGSGGTDDISGVSELCVKPIFRRLPADIQINEGQTARLDSIVTGRPNPEILWFRDGAPVYDDQFHKLVVNEDGISSLILLQASLKDAGNYRCVARNRGGEDSFNVTVKIVGEFVEY